MGKIKHKILQTTRIYKKMRLNTNGVLYINQHQYCLGAFVVIPGIPPSQLAGLPKDV